MNETTPYIWTPPAELVAASNLTAFLRVTGQKDYDDLASRAEADPAWLMQEVFKFCDILAGSQGGDKRGRNGEPVDLRNVERVVARAPDSIDIPQYISQKDQK